MSQTTTTDFNESKKKTVRSRRDKRSVERERGKLVGGRDVLSGCGWDRLPEYPNKRNKLDVRAVH